MTFKSKVLRQWDPKDYADEVDEGHYEILPSEFYPAMIAHIQKSLEQGDLPRELVDKDPHPDIDPNMAARRYRNWAKRITPQAWGDALKNLEEVVPLANPTKEQVARVVRRAEALECARLWFTRALKNAKAPPIYIHILNDPRFRLGVNVEFRA
jgi:hypothetical protein